MRSCGTTVFDWSKITRTKENNSLQPVVGAAGNPMCELASAEGTKEQSRLSDEVHNVGKNYEAGLHIGRPIGSNYRIPPLELTPLLKHRGLILN